MIYDVRMKTNWTIKKVPIYPKEWKVFPENRPDCWETNETRNYFEDEFEAMLEAEKRNNEEKDV